VGLVQKLSASTSSRNYISTKIYLICHPFFGALEKIFPHDVSTTCTIFLPSYDWNNTIDEGIIIGLNCFIQFQFALCLVSCFLCVACCMLQFTIMVGGGGVVVLSLVILSSLSSVLLLPVVLVLVVTSDTVLGYSADCIPGVHYCTLLIQYQFLVLYLVLVLVLVAVGESHFKDTCWAYTEVLDTFLGRNHCWSAFHRHAEFICLTACLSSLACNPTCRIAKERAKRAGYPKARKQIAFFSIKQVLL
jgi:hypothetical protein